MSQERPDGQVAKLLVFADLHLDAQFAPACRGADAARRRRLDLRETLRHIVALAKAESVDAVCCAGDLYEHERVTLDTVEFLRSMFAELNPIPIFISPGNHDWYGPASVYRQGAFSPNVRIFTEARLSPKELIPGVTLWGAAHCAPAGTPSFLANFRVDVPGVNLGIFHAAETGAFAEQGKSTHAPFVANQIALAGLNHAFLGHYHRANHAEHFTYPGNPCPLTFGEDGDRGPIIVQVEESGKVRRKTISVSPRIWKDLVVDLSGCASTEEVRQRVVDVLRDQYGVIRMKLVGSIDEFVDPRSVEFDSITSHLEGFVVRFDAVSLNVDVERFAAEPTVRGEFVRKVQSAGLAESERQRVLSVGLRALAGRSELAIT